MNFMLQLFVIVHYLIFLSQKVYLRVVLQLSITEQSNTLVLPWKPFKTNTILKDLLDFDLWNTVTNCNKI